MGRAGRLGRPYVFMSSRIGFSRSIGTIMFAPDCSPLDETVCTSREPTPSSRPSGPTSAAPPQFGCAGAVNRASSSTYSQ